jgi:hypothetical protein
MSSFSLQLSEDWGGGNYGPFGGTVMIGSDQARCQVLLRSDFPIEAQHLRISQTQDPRQLLLTPVSSDALVYLWRRGQAWEVSEPCIIQHGERFSLLSPAGPLLQVVIHSSQQAGVGGGGAVSQGSANGQRPWTLNVLLGLFVFGISTLSLVLILVATFTDVLSPSDDSFESVRTLTRSSKKETIPEEDLHMEHGPEGYFRNSRRTPKRNPDRFAQIYGENNWRSGRITGIDQFKRLKKESGITTIINLAQDALELQSDPDRKCGGYEVPCEPIWAREVGLVYVPIYLGVRGPSDENWEVIRGHLEEGNTLIHCSYGVDRTGTLVGRWLLCNLEADGHVTQQEVLDYTYSYGGQWQLKSDLNRNLRKWMLADDPCGDGR